MVDIVFKMEKVFYEKGFVIIKKNQQINEILLIKRGILEIYTYLDGNEFILERLQDGSILGSQ